MKAARKVAILVALRIILIIASFLTMVHFESQTSLTGNVVNVAEKTEFLPAWFSWS